MTTITLPRAVVEQALEAMEEACEIIGAAWAWRDEKGKPTITAFRAALAQQAEPVQESSAYSKDWCLRMAQIEMDAGAEFEIGPDRAQQAEPVAWAFRHSDGTYHDPSVTEHSAGMVPLYPPPPQRKPLTSDKDRPDQGATYIEGYGYVDTRAVRAVERAHNITGDCK